MTKKYRHLTIQEKSVIMTMRSEQSGIRAIARFLGRSAGTISRELAKTSGEDGTYNAELTHARSNRHRTSIRKTSKLDKNSELFKIVHEKLKLLWSPQQIARDLNKQWPDNREKSVSHETIYTAIYRQPRGAFKSELISCLRHHNQIRKPRSKGKDRRNQIKDMQSIHIRPAEVGDRLIPGHWEGDLIKGEGNRSSVGTLVERTTRFVVLAKMDNAGTVAVVDSFSAVLNQQPVHLRKSMTYDQGREMHGHKILAKRTGMQVYFADPHSPWQRGSNENTNGLLRQYMRKGSDLSTHSQADLDAIALSLNTRPRFTLGGRTPLAVYTEHAIRLQSEAATLINTGVALDI
jgi:transposase, IS30 family